jgi:hypothetical protein
MSDEGDELVEVSAFDGELHQDRRRPGPAGGEGPC